MITVLNTATDLTQTYQSTDAKGMEPLILFTHSGYFLAGNRNRIASLKAQWGYSTELTTWIKNLATDSPSSAGSSSSSTRSGGTSSGGNALQNGVAITGLTTARADDDVNDCIDAPAIYVSAGTLSYPISDYSINVAANTNSLSTKTQHTRATLLYKAFNGASSNRFDLDLVTPALTTQSPLVSTPPSSGWHSMSITGIHSGMTLPAEIQ